MTLDELIAELRRARAPHRRLDTEIARAVGYTKRAPEGSKPAWYAPNGDRHEPPFFTLDLGAAKDLANMVVPGRVVAVTWGDRASATINDESGRIEAATAALALCIAALSAANTGQDGRVIYTYPPVS